MLDLGIPYVAFFVIYNLVSLFIFFSISSCSVFFGFARLTDGFLSLTSAGEWLLWSYNLIYQFVLLCRWEYCFLSVLNNVLSVLL